MNTLPEEKQDAHTHTILAHQSHIISSCWEMCFVISQCADVTPCGSTAFHGSMSRAEYLHKTKNLKPLQELCLQPLLDESDVLPRGACVTAAEFGKTREAFPGGLCLHAASLMFDLVNPFSS